jgi:hypothetical protein
MFVRYIKDPAGALVKPEVMDSIKLNIAQGLDLMVTS